MNHNILIIYPEKCDGCMECETACLAKHGLCDHPEKSRIRVSNFHGDDFFMPVVCNHCENAPCMKTCPKEAISIGDSPGRVLINYAKCVGCSMCVFSCPFGAMKFDGEKGRPFKCDLCGGDPQCVAHCKPKALAFAAPEMLQYPGAIKAAQHFYKRKRP